MILLHGDIFDSDLANCNFELLPFCAPAASFCSTSQRHLSITEEFYTHDKLIKLILGPTKLQAKLPLERRRMGIWVDPRDLTEFRQLL